MDDPTFGWISSALILAAPFILGGIVWGACKFIKITKVVVSKKMQMREMEQQSRGAGALNVCAVKARGLKAAGLTATPAARASRKF